MSPCLGDKITQRTPYPVSLFEVSQNLSCVCMAIIWDVSNHIWSLDVKCRNHLTHWPKHPLQITTAVSRATQAIPELPPPPHCYDFSLNPVFKLRKWCINQNKAGGSTTLLITIYRGQRDKRAIHVEVVSSDSSSANRARDLSQLSRGRQHLGSTPLCIPKVQRIATTPSLLEPQIASLLSLRGSHDPG